MAGQRNDAIVDGHTDGGRVDLRIEQQFLLHVALNFGVLVHDDCLLDALVEAPSWDGQNWRP